MTTYRGCGTCTACCTVLDVPELDKPEGVPCQHLTDQGCGIYEDRPEACRTFECLYKVVDMAPRMRPDRSGFITTTQDTRLGKSLVMFVIGPIDPKAKKKARQMAKKLRLHMLWRRQNLPQLKGVGG
jgi:coenzyme F420-reducing hydrogenase beta subunit